jgi:hypothetical protein
MQSHEFTEFLLTGALGLALILVCCLIVYESLRFLWKLLPRLNWLPHFRVMVMVACSFLPHIANIWLFGFVYYLLHAFGLGTLAGTSIDSGNYTLDLFGCLYFSAVSYTTLGLGDVTPEGALRMITGVEALSGFMLIGWTVSFTYLAMQKFWELPHGRGRK